VTPIFGHSKSSEIFHSHFSKFYSFFFEYLAKNDIKNVLQLGDIFDQRKDIHFTTIKRSNEYFFDKIASENIDLYIISGNHDTVYKNTNEVNSVDLLCSDKATVIDLLPKTISFDGTDIDFFPWINQGNITESLEYVKNSTSKYAVGHFEFAGFPLYAGTIAESGMDHKIFNRYETVFSGHYHTISQKDSILYTGTPCELNWSDCNDSKGFWILDTDTGNLEHIKNPYNLFEKISYVEDMEYDFTTVKEKFIKIIIVDKKDQKKFDKFLNNIEHNQPHDVRVIETVHTEAVSDAVDLTELETTQSMISGVVDNLVTPVDKIKLKQRVLEIYTEAMSLTKT
jgi:DNA repair exonuclease SbcCD nuclease subunit